jgi:hypothetical protein
MTRRGALGSLAAGLVTATAGASAMAGALEAERRKKAKPKTCRRGQRLARVRVPASGATALTPVLRRGQRYRLRASGVIATNAVAGQDAEFGFLLATPADPKTLIDVFQGLDVGISIDGANPSWGPYNLAHVYEKTVVGRGRSLSLQLLDTQHSDNSGSLIVDVFCA